MAESNPLPTESKPEPDLTGRQLGDYQLLRRLGRGGMAEVYLAEQCSLHRKVAFKVLKNSLADDQSYVKRFRSEAQAAAALVHANIVQIHEVGRIDGVHYIAQEYVRGQNLRQFLDRNGPLSVSMAVNVMRQVCAALLRAGEQGIIHRDIKPENIMLSASGEVKVADFGLARVSSDGRGVDVTQIGVTMGTPLYMSPEQIEGRKVDPRSDLYSFGVTCYQMLAGRPPFEGETALSIALQHVRSDAPPLAEARKDLPSRLCEIVHKMLAKTPADRFGSAAELLRELRKLQVDGLEADWPVDADWSLEEFSSPNNSQYEATRTLDTLMKKESTYRKSTFRAGAAILLALVAFGGGGLAAWLTRPQPLLATNDIEQRVVRKMNTVDDQYWHALKLGTEDAWRAVIEYFPPDEGPADERPTRVKNTRRAKQRLGELYLEKRDFDRAMSYYTELANVESTDVQFRAIGFAGQANVSERKEDDQAAHLKLAMLADVINELQDQQYREELASLARQLLDSSLRLDFDHIREERNGKNVVGGETDSG